MNPRETPRSGRAFAPGARDERLRLHRAAPPPSPGSALVGAAGNPGVPLRAARLCRGLSAGSGPSEDLLPYSGAAGERRQRRCRPFPLSVPSRWQRQRRTPRAPRRPEPGRTAVRRGPPSPAVLPREHRSLPCSMLLCDRRASARECAVVNKHVCRGVPGCFIFVSSTF